MRVNRDGTVTTRLTCVRPGYRGKNYQTKVAEMAKQGYELASEREEGAFLMLTFSKAQYYIGPASFEIDTLGKVDPLQADIKVEEAPSGAFGSVGEVTSVNDSEALQKLAFANKVTISFRGESFRAVFAVQNQPTKFRLTRPSESGPTVYGRPTFK